MKAPRITLYTTRNCPNCRRAKHYLKQKGMWFQELDVDQNTRAKKMFARLGARAVPVVMIGDTRIDGFNRELIDSALRQANRY
jgi:glutaredoxin-like YruB-family protein